jgi:hypothetical protein
MANTGEQSPKDGPLRLTYAALGARLGISPDAARMLARRRDWHRVIANRRGAPTIVVVPEDELASQQWRAGEHDPNIPDAPENDAEERAEQAEQRAVVAERRSDEAHGRADAALALADRTLAQLADALTAERTRVDALRERADEMHRDLKASEAIAHELRADLDAARAQAQANQEVADVQARLMAARRSLGLLARLRSAWRGE